jgi:NADH:ubiquinone oxidoreductase subunit E
MSKKIIKVQVCYWKTCKENFSEYIVRRIEWDVLRLNLDNVEIEKTMCMWMCKKWPNVKVDDDIINYAEPAKVSDRVLNWPKKKKIKKTNKNK